jgi:hypothetical protein
MKYRWTLAVIAVSLALSLDALAWNQLSFTVVPFAFDAYGSHLVAAKWLEGIGCPTAASFFNGTTSMPDSYTDLACPTGDPSDKRNEGLLLAKTGPTANVAFAGASVVGAKGVKLTELGYDIRKAGVEVVIEPRGSHCSARAPRFEIESSGKKFFIGCNMPPGTPLPPVEFGWQRLRWGGVAPLLAISDNAGQTCDPFPVVDAPTGLCNITNIQVDKLSIVFDEGQDPPAGEPDEFGMAVLDNIDINTVLIGRGASNPDDGACDDGDGEDHDHDHFDFHNSGTRPETSRLSYVDAVNGVTVQTLGAARDIVYSGTCVSFVGDALMNGQPGYAVTFAACDLSSLGLSIGNFTMTVTGATGVVYQKAAALASGKVTIHEH